AHFYGYVPDELARHPWVAHYPLEPSYRTFIRSLYQKTWDIGIAPLHDTLFNHCKTNNKFREYSACWIPGIYSAMPAYQECVTDGETGILVPHTTEGWYLVMRKLIDDPRLRLKINQQAGVFARQTYSIA